MDNKTTSVNLLKTQQKSFVDKFTGWALTIGRFIIIITEVIALSTFLYRFVLDRQIVDQKDRINGLASQVKLFNANEKTYRDLQDRLALSATLDALTPNQINLFTDIIKLAPAGFTFNKLTIASDQVRLEANAQSVATITRFVNALKKQKAITSVSVDKIENKTLSATIVIGISAKIQTTPTPPFIKK